MEAEAESVGRSRFLQGICRASAGHREQEIDLQLLSRLAQPPVRDRV